MNKNALAKIVKAGRTAKQTDDALRELGYNDTPYFDIYGNIADALYLLLGEDTETFDQSVTHRIMESTSESQQSELLSMFCEEA